MSISFTTDSKYPVRNSSQNAILTRNLGSDRKVRNAAFAAFNNEQSRENQHDLSLENRAVQITGSQRIESDIKDELNITWKNFFVLSDDGKNLSQVKSKNDLKDNQSRVVLIKERTIYKRKSDIINKECVVLDRKGKTSKISDYKIKEIEDSEFDSVVNRFFKKTNYEDDEETENSKIPKTTQTKDLYVRSAEEINESILLKIIEKREKYKEEKIIEQKSEEKRLFLNMKKEIETYR